MNLEKHLEFFNPLEVKEQFHIIGCGAIGSNIAENLARLGLTNIHLYDFDIVEPHNVANQLFYEDQQYTLKTDALATILARINPSIELALHNKGWLPGQRLRGHVFLCVDNIDTRRAIVEENLNNPQVKGFYDFRMRLTDAQHYAADTSPKLRQTLLDSMQFTHEEAKEATPVSACRTTLSVLPTIRMITSAGVGNMINYIKTGKIRKLVLIDAFGFFIDAY